MRGFVRKSAAAGFITAAAIALSLSAAGAANASPTADTAIRVCVDYNNDAEINFSGIGHTGIAQPGTCGGWYKVPAGTAFQVVFASRNGSHGTSPVYRTVAGNEVVTIHGIPAQISFSQ